MSIADRPPGTQTVNSTHKTGSEVLLSIKQCADCYESGRQRSGCKDKKPWLVTWGLITKLSRELCVSHCNIKLAMKGVTGSE